MTTIRPGIYITFSEKAEAQLAGTKGTVAIPLMSYNKTAEAKKFYSVKTEKQAINLFGVSNIRSIKLALQGGAAEVLVYTMPVVDGDAVTLEAAIEEALLELETRTFNAVAFDCEVSDSVQDRVKAWVVEKRKEGKHFFVILGGNDEADQNPETGNARTKRLADDYVINIINGVVANGEALNSAEIAPFVAGLVASAPLNQAITYREVAFEDVTKRLRHAEIETALETGSFLFARDEVTRIEQGLVSTGKKIRSVAARQAVATDVRKTIASQYIGKLTNNTDSRKSLISAVKSYLERLEGENVLSDIEVYELEVEAKDAVSLAIAYTETDSVEKVYINISL